MYVSEVRDGEMAQGFAASWEDRGPKKESLKRTRLQNHCVKPKRRSEAHSAPLVPVVAKAKVDSNQVLWWIDMKIDFAVYTFHTIKLLQKTQKCNITYVIGGREAQEDFSLFILFTLYLTNSDTMNQQLSLKIHTCSLN